MTILVAAPISTAGVQTVLLYSIPYPGIAESKRPVADRCGYLVGGPDRRGANAIPHATMFRKWQLDVEAAIPEGIVPQAVVDYYQRTKHLTRPPAEDIVIEIGIQESDLTPESTGLDALDLGFGSKPTTVPQTMEIPMSAKVIQLDPFAPPARFRPPRFTWSLTALQDFENCPRSYGEKRFYKRVVDAPFDAKDWGNRLHKTAEDYTKDTRDGRKNTYEPELLKIVQPYANAIVKSAKGGILLVEHDLAFTEKFVPCLPTDWDTVWYRGKSDITLIQRADCFVYDWKSGKVKDDDTQLQLMCACEALLHPEVQTFTGRYIWLKGGTVSNPCVMQRKDLVAVWSGILSRVKRMQQACSNQIFQARTSGLCKKYCSVTKCPHCGAK